MEYDKYLWKNDADDYKDYFSSARTWEQIRCKKEAVNWSNRVWFKQGIPRCTFIVWLAIHNMLSTGDRMRQWGITQGCVFCGERDETRVHLFFACPYSYRIWDRVASRLIGRRINPDWSDMLKLVCGGAYSLMDQILIRLLFQVVFYHVWRERNLRRHQQGIKGTYQLICMVSQVVKNRISSLGYKGHHRLEGLMRRWF